jgi:hypothetical protein
VVFCSATVWAGVVAAQRPITCPNRQLQPERYVQYWLKLIQKDDKIIIDTILYLLYNNLWVSYFFLRKIHEN